MNILFDNNVPVYLLDEFSTASTAFREGWHELANGNLLTVAEEAGFTLLITLDRGFETQQSLSGRSTSVAILRPAAQSRDSFKAVARKLAQAIQSIEPGQVVSLAMDGV